MAAKKFSSKASIFSRRKTVITLEDITEEDKVLAREMWIQIEENHIVITRTLFSDLFALYPEYKHFFKDLIDPKSTDEDAWLNPRFEHHMIQVLLPALGNIIRELDNPENVREQMIKLGQVHKNKNMGLKRKNVEALKDVFIQTMDKCLVKGMWADHGLAMAKIFSYAFGIFEDALEGKYG